MVFKYNHDVECPECGKLVKVLLAHNGDKACEECVGEDEMFDGQPVRPKQSSKNVGKFRDSNIIDKKGKK